MKRSIVWRAARAAVVAAFSGVVVGCADSLNLPEKGVYAGPQDEPLDEATLKSLKARAERQSYN